jgi:hypothetical protein
MNAKRGYYSLIQFCPDPGRLEAVNLGVVLFCPESGYLQARVTTSNVRVRRFFGQKSFDNWALNQAKQALVARLEIDRQDFRTREDLEKFIQTRANAIILSPLRPVKVLKSPERELDDLFEELVGTERRPAQRCLIVPELDNVFKRLQQEGRAVLNVPVRVPVLGKTLRIPYAYRNGAVHLVKPEKFPEGENQATAAAMKLAVEGDLLQKYGEDDQGRKRLVVVSTFASDRPNLDLQERIVRVLKEYEVRAVLPAELPEFVEAVQKEAH